VKIKHSAIGALLRVNEAKEGGGRRAASGRKMIVGKKGQYFGFSTKDSELRCLGSKVMFNRKWRGKKGGEPVQRKEGAWQGFARKRGPANEDTPPPKNKPKKGVSCLGIGRKARITKGSSAEAVGRGIFAGRNVGEGICKRS